MKKQQVLNIVCPYVLAIVIRHVKHMRRVILSSVDCPALPYLYMLPHTRHYFRGGGGEWEKKGVGEGW